MKFREHEIQTACVRWFDLQHAKDRRGLFAIPNGKKIAGSQLQRQIRGKRLKEEGVRAGTADLFLSIPSQGFHGFYLETKTKAGRQSPDQKEFQRYVEDQGYKYAVVRSVEQFIALVTEYLRK